VKRRAATRVPGAAQHERSEVMRCRPGTATNSECGTVPDQRCTTRAAHSRCTASGTHDIERRAFIAMLGGAAAAWPLAARAQQAERMRRIGVLMHTAADEAESQARLAAFMQGLQELGWAVGRNLRIDYRWSVGDSARLYKDAAELVGLAPEVILAGVGGTIAALQQASRIVPIVVAQGIDPVGNGYVESLARPGGDITGFIQFEYTLAGKWMELLKEVAPGITRVGVLREPGAGGIGQWVMIQAVAQSFGAELRPIDLRDASEIERSVAAFARSPNGGLIVAVSAASLTHRDLIIRLAAQHRLPAVYAYRVFVTHGGLLTYGPDIVAQYRRAAGYLDRILKGEKAADLPVQAPTKYELVINLKTAKALGLEVPPTVLARADEVIE
jgi:putative ABC transport system substrate-binding protein